MENEFETDLLFDKEGSFPKKTSPSALDSIISVRTRLVITGYMDVQCLDQDVQSLDKSVQPLDPNVPSLYQDVHHSLDHDIQSCTISGSGCIILYNLWIRMYNLA
jgi:hypothetical protein